MVARNFFLWFLLYYRDALKGSAQVVFSCLQTVQWAQLFHLRFQETGKRFLVQPCTFCTLFISSKLVQIGYLAEIMQIISEYKQLKLGRHSFLTATYKTYCESLKHFIIFTGSPLHWPCCSSFEHTCSRSRWYFTTYYVIELPNFGWFLYLAYNRISIIFITTSLDVVWRPHL